MSPDRDPVRIAAGDARCHSDGRAEWWGRPGVVMVVVGLLVTLCAAVQSVRDGRYGQQQVRINTLYLRSGAVLERGALSFDALLADVYWIRAIQNYGRTKLSDDDDKDYTLLYPLLDITTTLDPRFDVAYRFGAIFLTEAFPNGPGRPDLAVSLLQKGFSNRPERWQYLQDIGFVYYWWLQDFQEAARWFQRASEVPGASWWLRSLAANTMTQGGNRGASRLLWQQMYESADNEWMRSEVLRRLAQLEALDLIDLYEQVVAAFRERTGRLPRSWGELVAAGSLTAVPLDPDGTEFTLLPSGDVTVASRSALFPLPDYPQTPGTAAR